MTPRILIVEDDEGIREMLKLTLELEGYRVETAGDGREAWNMLHDGTVPDLILLDLMMPVMDGWALAETMAKDGRLGTIPIVVVSAFAERPPRTANVMGLVKKPVDIEDLLEQVKANSYPSCRARRLASA